MRGAKRPGRRTWLLTVLVLFAGACSEDRERIQPPPSTDATPPAAILDLATSQITPSTVRLTWTAPGDDDTTGTADRYDIRYSTGEITEANFTGAIAVADPPPPFTAGTAQSLVVSGLFPGTPYTFALKAADEVPNWSGLSNAPHVTTVANAAPEIDTLTVSATATAPGGTLTLHCLAHDADGDSVAYVWQATSGLIEGDGPEASWIAPATEGLYRISVTASDHWGFTAADTLIVASDAFEGTLLVQSRDGLTAIDAAGSSFVLHRSTAEVEVLGARIFLAGYRGIEELDHQGNELMSVEADPPVAGYVTLLPDLGFAVITNDADVVYLVAPTGAVIDTIPMPNPSPESLQNIEGVVVGDRLVVSENGSNEVFAVDLVTHETSIVRSVQDGHGWLGSIDYRDGTYYLCRSNRVQAFTVGGDLREICGLPEHNITGIAATGRFAYVVLNFAGALYRVDLETGEYQRAVTGLGYPQDIEILPVRLTRP